MDGRQLTMWQPQLSALSVFVSATGDKTVVLRRLVDGEQVWSVRLDASAAMNLAKLLIEAATRP